MHFIVLPICSLCWNHYDNYWLQRERVDKATKIFVYVTSLGEHQLPPCQLVTEDVKERIVEEQEDQDYNIEATDHMMTQNNSCMVSMFY